MVGSDGVIGDRRTGRRAVATLWLVVLGGSRLGRRKRNVDPASGQRLAELVSYNSVAWFGSRPP